MITRWVRCWVCAAIVLLPCCTSIETSRRIIAGGIPLVSNETVSAVQQTLAAAKDLTETTAVRLGMQVPDEESVPYAALALSTFLAVSFLALLVTSCLEFSRFMHAWRKTQAETYVPPHGAPEITAGGGDVAELPQIWSVPGIILLNGYRFYTGFMNSTWLPYLCAMDGARMWQENQSLFMAYCKLIYGLTVVFNPLYGVVADKAVSISHGVGRRAFIRIGFFMATVGILICMLCSRMGQDYYYPYMFGVLLWRVGEALNDVTTEALPPEVVDDSQWQIAASIKAGLFLCGGVLGYILLVIMVDINYTWLYWAYLVLMLVCGVPALVLVDDDRPLATARSHSQTFRSALSEAYLEPLAYGKGFPQACMAVFVFSLGTAPMFFFLLIVRDLVQVGSAHALQLQFCFASIMFFLSAALASVAGPLCHVSQVGTIEDRNRRWNLLVLGIFLFSTITIFIPIIPLFADRIMRLEVLYVLAIAYGSSFGIAYGRFQDCTWQLLPDRKCGETATLMGFNNMCKLAGAGAGNFIAGLLLDMFVRQEQAFSFDGLNPREKDIFWLIYQYWKDLRLQDEVAPVYSVTGYTLLCFLCAMLTAVAGLMTLHIPRPDAQDEPDEKLAADRAAAAPRS
mmetsp:Transcript_35603/g.83235  ORF Transcript_35603/g.83235 Transcript_35603/m.83235 type:complete len:625 (+) Transcript_35603:219-2093(+)